MDLLNHARSVHLGGLKMPVLIIYTDRTRSSTPPPSRIGSMRSRDRPS
jgi:hypothetical protein